MCNVVGVIERGELLFSGDVREIMRRARVGHVVHVRVTERSEDAANVLRKAPGVTKVGLSDTDHGVQINLTLDEESPIDASDIPARLVNAGFRVAHFTEEQVDLETAFMRLTKGVVQ